MRLIFVLNSTVDWHQVRHSKEPLLKQFTLSYRFSHSFPFCISRLKTNKQTINQTQIIKYYLIYSHMGIKPRDKKTEIHDF